MAECVICGIVEGKTASKTVYEDSEVLGFLDYNGAVLGHAYIVPKKHYPIFEQVPDEVVSSVFKAANKISGALFDAMGAQGTNIFVSNGVSAGQSVAHFTVNVIPRKEGDNVNLEWKPIQLSEEERSTAELKIKEVTKDRGAEKQEEKYAPEKKEKRESLDADEENYLWKSVNRK